MHDSTNLESELHALLASGKKIAAIKLYKEHTGASLLVAKNAVEDFARGGSLPPSLAMPSATGDDSLTAEVRDLLLQGQKLQAVKLYKDRTGASLKDAKRAVESLTGGRSLPAPAVDERLAAELLPSLRMGDKREAIRLYQKRTGAGARDARRAVAALAKQHGMYDRESACLTTAVLLAIVSALVLAVGAAVLLLS